MTSIAIRIVPLFLYDKHNTLRLKASRPASLAQIKQTVEGFQTQTFQTTLNRTKAVVSWAHLMLSAADENGALQRI